MHLDSISYCVWTKDLSILVFCDTFLGIFSGSYSLVLVIMIFGWTSGVFCFASFTVFCLSSFAF